MVFGSTTDAVASPTVNVALVGVLRLGVRVAGQFVDHGVGSSCSEQAL
jgi:hypothetical protein